MKVTSVLVGSKADVVEEHLVKLSSLGSSDETEKFILKSFLIAEDPHCKGLSGVELALKVSSIPMAGEDIMDSLTWDIKSISASTMDWMNSFMGRVISTESRASRAMPKPDCPGSEV